MLDASAVRAQLIQLAREDFPIPTESNLTTWLLETIQKEIETLTNLVRTLQALQRSSSSVEGAVEPAQKKRKVPGGGSFNTVKRLAKMSKTADRVEQLLKEKPAEPKASEKAPPVPKEDSKTGKEIRAYLKEAVPPFTRGNIYKGLKWKGTELTRAMVAGWIARALRRGELVEPTPGEFYPQGYVPPARSQAEDSAAIHAVARGDVQEFEVISGAGGLM